MKLAKDRLLVYGLTADDIGHIPDEEGEDRARFILHSRVDGKVSDLVAFAGQSYNGSELLITHPTDISYAEGVRSQALPRE